MPVNASANLLLAALPDHVLKHVQPQIKQVQMQHGARLFEPGAQIDRVYFPHSGMVSVLIVLEGGNAIEVSTVGREGAIGFRAAFGMSRSFSQALVQIPATFSVVPADLLRKMVDEDAETRKVMIRYALLLHLEAQQNAACNAAHSADQRLSRWILQTCDRTESDSIPLTQEFLAEMLGVRRSTVSILAGALQKAGLIDYRRGKINIRDRNGLKRHACECYGVIRKLYAAERDCDAASYPDAGNRSA